eukprot:gene13282-biopygen10592
MVVTGRPNQDRRYDSPTAAEIAAIYTAHDRGALNPADRELQARTKDGTYMKLFATEPTADPMTHPLLFSMANMATMLISEDSSHKTAIKIKIVIVAHQLRVDSYQGLMDHLNRRATMEMQMANTLNPNQPVEIEVGHVVILPSSFTGNADQIDIITEQQQGLEMLTSLNPERHEIHTKVIEAVQNQSEQNCYFVDGPAGTGKTFLYITVVHRLQSMGHKVQCMVWSGIAATLLINARTSHWTFQIPIPLLPNCTGNIKIQSARAQMLRNTTLFIWDEASMIPKNALRAVDTLLRDITQVKRPFGGKFMLLGGDFRHVLPVINRAGREKIVAESLKSMQIRDLWGIFEQHRLHRNVRAIQDAPIRNFLRIGNHTEPQDENEIITLPDRICVNSSQQMIDSIYPHPTSAEANLMLNPLAMSERCCLTPKNEYSHEINKLILQRLQTPTHTYFSADEVLTDDPEEAHVYLNAQTASSMPLHKLELKVGAIVILLINLNPIKASAMAHG